LEQLETLALQLAPSWQRVPFSWLEPWLALYLQYLLVHLLVGRQGGQRHVDVVWILVLLRYPT
jgi:hypothetical protein